MTTRWKSRRRPRAASAAADLQPSGPSALDPSLEERLARLEADQELVLRLGLNGFAGREWDAFVTVLAEYGLQVFRSWIRTGKVFAECRHSGPRRRFRDEDEITEVAGEVVAEAIVAFRKDVLLPGTWDATKGASLRTFFIGNCKFQFSNVYRRWAKETERRPADVDDGKICAELEHQRAPLVSIEVAAELRRQAPRLRSGSIEHINVLDAAGYTNAEIANINNTTEGAINAAASRPGEGDPMTTTIEALIERSSFGEPRARAMRARTPMDAARRVLERLSARSAYGSDVTPTYEASDNPPPSIQTLSPEPIMECKSDFEEFLTEIRPTKSQKDDLKTGHTTLRDRLASDETLSKIIVSDFLQGSYKRHTAVRPKGDKRADVDIIVVTKLAESEYTPEAAMKVFTTFLDKHYKGKWRFQGRSIGIELSYVDLDLVITAAPSDAEVGILKSAAVLSDADLDEARDWRLNDLWQDPETLRFRADARDIIKAAQAKAEWKASPLRIPDRDAKAWDDTNPLEQIRWTADKNKATNWHFVNVVKALKWWRLEQLSTLKHPKGFPLERMVGDCCPDGISSVAEGVVATLEAMVSKYSSGKPKLPDYGVAHHDVLGRLTAADFTTFYSGVTTAAVTARRAIDAVTRTDACKAWRELFGGKFPKYEEKDGGKNGGAGFKQPSEPAIPGSGRFA